MDCGILFLPGWMRTAFGGDKSDEDEEAEEPYDDEQDHDKCTDCKGTGWYVGLVDRRHCPTCDGSGYV